MWMSKAPGTWLTDEHHSDDDHGTGCSTRKTLRESSVVGGCVTGRGLGSSLIRNTLPASPSRQLNQSLCTDEQLTGTQRLPDASKRASPAFRKTEHGLFLRRTAKVFLFPSHCPFREDQERQEREGFMGLGILEKSVGGRCKQCSKAFKKPNLKFVYC